MSDLIDLPGFLPTSDPREVVKDRLTLIEGLLKSGDYFKGQKFYQHKSDKYTSHFYRHYHALTIYLSLTCFDILGQPSDWLAFPSWLQSKRADRIEAFKQFEGKELTAENTSLLFIKYNNLYGVRNSFFRFIREVISSDARKALLGSMELWDVTDGKYDRLEFDDLKKEQFLFSMRNDFTHNGISYGNPARGLSGYELAVEKFKIWAPEVKWNEVIFRELKGGRVRDYKVAEWPELLISIVSSAL